MIQCTKEWHCHLMNTGLTKSSEAIRMLWLEACLYQSGQYIWTQGDSDPGEWNAFRQTGPVGLIPNIRR